jgi:hypothetical protein
MWTISLRSFPTLMVASPSARVEHLFPAVAVLMLNGKNILREMLVEAGCRILFFSQMCYPQSQKAGVGEDSKNLIAVNKKVLVTKSLLLRKELNKFLVIRYLILKVTVLLQLLVNCIARKLKSSALCVFPSHKRRM